MLTQFCTKAKQMQMQLLCPEATRAPAGAEEYASLQRVLEAVNLQKADLEGKVVKAAGALNAAEELKEARWASL